MTGLAHWFRLIAFSCREIGVFPTFRSQLVSRLRRQSDEDDPFDRDYGTDTSGTLTPSEAQLSGDRAEEASAYTPIPTDELRRMIEDSGIPHEALGGYTFVDIGSGKGRAVLMAASYPFKRVCGVEMSEMLHAAAQQNAAIFQERAPACPPIELCCEDATTFEFPDGPLILFFFHPFGESVMSQVMDNLGQTLQKTPRPIVILYNRGINLKPYAPEMMQMGGLFHCLVERSPRAWRGQTGWYVYRHTPTAP
ncbi:MAG: class I SAM-dependent methyltransferase [Candidatus Tectomicrobia bacterium]|nr:class I SAM-dependent methyltransferase [Candidatus Tectomicrobia bacterium]